MEAPRTAARSRDRLAAWVGPALTVALAAVAYRPLLASALQLPTEYSVERWLFRPSALPAPLVLMVAAWLAWRRRQDLYALPARAAPWAGAALAGLGGAGFVWASLARAGDLLFVSLSVQLVAFGAAVRGRAGVRALGLPALVLLFGVRIPAPLLDEIVWHLQQWTASGAARLLAALGHDLVHGGVVLRTGTHAFQVIDGCCGLQGIEILLLVAILTRELFSDTGARQWLLVLLAPPLGFALNVVRVAYVASSPNPEALAGLQGDHTPQGIAVLVAGTGILYGLGWWMARSGDAGSRAPGPPPSERRAPWAAASAWLAALALLPLAITPFAPRPPSSVAHGVHFPENGSNWKSAPLDIDPLFIGALPAYERVHRRFELQSRPPMVVELFVGREMPEIPYSSSLLSSKLTRPGPDWDLVRSRRERLWLLDRDADLSLAMRPPGDEYAVVYTWRLRDRGLWRESWRSLLALDSSPFARERARTVVQLLTYAPYDTSLAVDRAKQRLDRFIADFREALAAL